MENVLRQAYIGLEVMAKHWQDPKALDERVKWVMAADVRELVLRVQEIRDLWQTTALPPQLQPYYDTLRQQAEDWLTLYWNDLPEPEGTPPAPVTKKAKKVSRQKTKPPQKEFNTLEGWNDIIMNRRK